MTDSRDEPTSTPLPDRGWSRTVVSIRNAVVVPPTRRAVFQPSGIYSPDGTLVPQGGIWRNNTLLTPKPGSPSGELHRIGGRHLYCGQFWSHFGHFTMESLTRVWALDRCGPINSLLFIDRQALAKVSRPIVVNPKLHSYQADLLAIYGIDLPITIVSRPVQVEDLVIPGQGFGLGSISAGTPEYRAFVKAKVAENVPRHGPRKLYISRTRLTEPLRGVLLENRIEAALAAYGYAVFHPQKHNLRDQMAAYRAAETILGLDGSPFHIVGLVAESSQQIGVIERRITGNQDPMYVQLRGFTGREPFQISTLTGQWLCDHRARPNHFLYGEIAFADLGRRLVEGGFIPDLEHWPTVSDEELSAEAARIGAANGVTLVRLADGMTPSLYRRRLARQPKGRARPVGGAAKAGRPERQLRRKARRARKALTPPA